jgi:hypothetical protein
MSICLWIQMQPYTNMPYIFAFTIIHKTLRDKRALILQPKSSSLSYTIMNVRSYITTSALDSVFFRVGRFFLNSLLSKFYIRKKKKSFFRLILYVTSNPSRLRTSVMLSRHSTYMEERDRIDSNYNWNRLQSDGDGLTTCHICSIPHS